MPTRTLNFNNLTPAAPYVVGSAPDNLTGYSKTAGSLDLAVTDLSGTKYFVSTGGTTNAVWRDDTVLSGAVRSAFITTGLTNGSAVGAALLDAGNDGYVALTSDGTGNTRLFKIVDSQLGAQIGSSITKTHADNQVREIRWETGGIISLWDGATQIGSNFSDATYTPIYAAALSRGGRVRSMSSYYVAAQTITSINSGSPITVGQTGVVINHTGFTGAATAVTTNRAGVTATITAGDANSTTVNVSGWAEGVEYPVVDNTVTFTVSRSGESAAGDQTLTKPAGFEKVVFSGAITADENLIGYGIEQAGHVVEGGAFYYDTTTVDDLTVLADTDWTADPAGGTFESWFIPATGSTAGEAYRFDITVLNGSIISGTTPDPFTFTAVTDAEVGTTYTSNEITISGLGDGVAADLTIVDGNYSKNGGGFVSTAGTISNGDTLKVRRNSSGSYSTAVNLDVTVGTYTTQFSITTKSDNDPDTIKFTTLSALSDIKTITGVTGSVAISVVGGEYSKNGGGFTASAGTVVNDDTIQLSAANGATVRVTIGGKTFSWSSKGGGGGFGGSIGIGI